VLAGNTLVAAHARCWAAHQTVTDPDHATAAAALRAAHTAATRPPDQVEVQQRDLASYDRAFQVIDGATATDTGQGVA